MDQVPNRLTLLWITKSRKNVKVLKALRNDQNQADFVGFLKLGRRDWQEVRLSFL